MSKKGKEKLTNKTKQKNKKRGRNGTRRKTNNKEEKVDRVQIAVTSFCAGFPYLKEHGTKIAIVSANMYMLRVQSGPVPGYGTGTRGSFQ